MPLGAVGPASLLSACFFLTLLVGAVAGAVLRRASVPLPDSEYVGDARVQYERMVTDLMLVTPEHVAGCLQDAAETEKLSSSDELAELVYFASGWAKLSSLVDLRKLIVENNVPIFTDLRGATLSDFLLYVSTKCLGCPPGVVKSDDVLSGAFHNSVKIASCDWRLKNSANRMSDVAEVTGVNLLLDTMLLRQIEEIKSFRDHVRANLHTLRFVVPSGFINGINMFNQLSTCDVIKTLAKTFSDHLKSHDTKQQALIAVLHDDIIARLAKALALSTADVGGRLVFLDPPLMSAGLPKDINIAQAIARNLQPKYPSFEEFLSVHERVAVCWEDGFPQVLDFMNTAKFFSFNALVANLRSVHKDLDIDFDRLLIPEFCKSYGAIALVYLMTFPDVPLSKVFKQTRSIDWADDKYLKKGEKVLILDDMAGTGSSLTNVAAHLKDPIVSPIIQAPHASEKFAQYGIKSRPAVLLADPKKVYPWMGDPGFQGGYFNVAFPYAAPDNNCAFAAFHVAPLFSECGIKTGETMRASTRCVPGETLLQSHSSEIEFMTGTLRERPQCVLYAQGHLTEDTKEYISNGIASGLPRSCLTDGRRVAAALDLLKNS